MMTELEPEDFSKALLLYRAAGGCFPLLLAVIEGKQRGQIFVDEQDCPKTALVVNNFGFMGLLEAEPNELFDEHLATLFETGGNLRSSYLLWYAPPMRWQAKLDRLAPNVARRRERVRLNFTEDRAVYLRKPTPLPPEFELKTLDTETLSQSEKFGLHIDSRFWSSAADVIEHGSGVCLLEDDEVLSLCYAAAVAGGFAEVDVVTAPQYQGRGLAQLVAEQFVRECLGRGIIPTWDCFTYNASSLRLALRLGFIKAQRYPFYSFNVPLELNALRSQG